MIRLPIVLIAVMIAGPAWGEEVLICTDTAAQGYMWTPLKTARIDFSPGHYVVKIISENNRKIGGIGALTGDGRAVINSYSCHRPHAKFSSSTNKDKRRLSRRIVCDLDGVERWVFHDDTYARSDLRGPPAGSDPYGQISLSYGTCVKY